MAYARSGAPETEAQEKGEAGFGETFVGRSKPEKTTPAISTKRLCRRLAAFATVPELSSKRYVGFERRAFTTAAAITQTGTCFILATEAAVSRLAQLPRQGCVSPAGETAPSLVAGRESFVEGSGITSNGMGVAAAKGAEARAHETVSVFSSTAAVCETVTPVGSSLPAAAVGSVTALVEVKRCVAERFESLPSVA